MQDQVTRIWDEGLDGPRRGDMVSCTQQIGRAHV